VEIIDLLAVSAINITGKYKDMTDLLGEITTFLYIIEGLTR